MYAAMVVTKHGDAVATGGEVGEGGGVIGGTAEWTKEKVETGDGQGAVVDEGGVDGMLLPTLFDACTFTFASASASALVDSFDAPLGLGVKRTRLNLRLGPEGAATDLRDTGVGGGAGAESN